MAMILTAGAAQVVAHTTDLSVGTLVAQADIIVKLVIALLLGASFWCWAIIFEKWKTFRGLNYRSDKFEKLFAAGASPDQIYERLKNKSDNPMSTVFIAAMREWKDGALKNVSRPAPDVKAYVLRRMDQVMHAVKHQAVEKMENRMIFLATVAASAPFIGLFGTVWGIMNSFQSIAASQNTTLAVVAPGIAESLLATGIGLFAAIPALIFYNMYGNEIRRYANRLEDFVGYLGTMLAYEIEHGK